MAGHSQFKNIMYRKGAQDKKRAKLFAKLGRELTVAAKMGGDDSASNPRLRAAITSARSNMPKENVERAIKKGVGGGDGENFEEIRYEGYGPGGIAVIVEALTDNRNRTASEVRAIFSKHGGSLAETGAVSFLFDRVGEIRFALTAVDTDMLLEAALDAGAEDVITNDDSHEIICTASELHAVSNALEDVFGEPQSSKLVWRPQTNVQINDRDVSKLLNFLEALDDNDDVQMVSANFYIADEIMERFTA